MMRVHIGGRCALLLGALVSAASAEDARQPGELFPVLDSFDSGHLKVSERHTIAYSLHGNPEGKPVFVLHGGPGFGSYPRLTQYFNPEKFLIVLHDQRGSGRSRPVGELRENTTQNLVRDIERLRGHLGIEKRGIVFGGSWGSTLGLAYAEAHPENISGMVLRGVFTATQAEIDQIFNARGARLFFPDAVARLEGALPRGGRDFSHAGLLRIFNSDDEALRSKVAAAWCRYGIKIGRLHTPDELVEQSFDAWDPLPMCRIDCHYMSNGCFLEEGQLLRDAHKLTDIPVTIINGRYDMICPPVSAYRLHKLLPKSKLIIVEQAGHSEGEEGTTRALVEAVAQFE
jgi:proline iminopeptidase